MKHSLLYSLAILWLCACGTPGEKIDQQAVRQEMEDREIKRVLPGQIIEAANEQGDSIAAILRQQLQQQNPPVTSADQFSAFAQKMIRRTDDSLRSLQGTRIGWAAPRDTASNNLTTLERQVLSAYLYNVDKKIAVNNNVQKLHDTAYLYTSPLFYNKAQQEARQAFTQSGAAQPDSALFLGMWRIRLSKKHIIQGM